MTFRFWSTPIHRSHTAWTRRPTRMNDKRFFFFFSFFLLQTAIQLLRMFIHENKHKVVNNVRPFLAWTRPIDWRGMRLEVQRASRPLFCRLLLVFFSGRSTVDSRRRLFSFRVLRQYVGCIQRQVYFLSFGDWLFLRSDCFLWIQGTCATSFITSCQLQTPRPPSSPSRDHCGQRKY